MKPREKPADWDAVVPYLSTNATALHYGMSLRTISRLVADGAQRPGKFAVGVERLLPDNLAELTELHTLRSLAVEIGWPRRTLQRRLERDMPEILAKLKSNGIQAAAKWAARQRRDERPADFAAVAMRLSVHELADHYEVPVNVAILWLRGMDDAYKTKRNAARKAAQRGGAASSRPVLDNPRHRAFALQIVHKPSQAVTTEATKAMRWLQRIGPCYPLSVVCGRNVPGYRFNGRIWQAQELIAEARRRGWQPDAWRQIVRAA